MGGDYVMAKWGWYLNLPFKCSEGLSQWIEMKLVRRLKTDIRRRTAMADDKFVQGDES